ncbi:MAG TPA: class I SAM-dependent methyltransferase [Nocardioides sp.]|uniref:class I SAM-dependent methyltransferase n=1 Tax=Nocardioides sp. TaxID=35761 RepID=UPI002F41DA2B
MGQNIYDDPEFQAGYRRLARSEEGLAGAPEWPSVRALLPDLTDKQVVDLGCGYGAFARWAAESGAALVDAFDLSEQMLARAGELTGPSAPITYTRADLDTLTLPAAAYDVAYSALVLHYLVDLSRFVGMVHGALRPGGSFVLTCEHPVYTAPTESQWIEHDGRRSWPLDRYGEEGVRVRDWLAPGVRKQHRTLGTLLNTLLDAGFTLRRVLESVPSPEQVEAQPELAEERDRPMFLMVAADR